MKEGGERQGRKGGGNREGEGRREREIGWRGRAERGGERGREGEQNEGGGWGRKWQCGDREAGEEKQKGGGGGGREREGEKEESTLRASLSGTLLQTLPDLVTPLKGHSLSPRSCPATRSAPSESRFGY